MSQKTKELADYWSVYTAINKHRFSKSREFTDRKNGKTMKYEFIGADVLSGSVFMQVFSSILWVSPVLLIIFIALAYISVCPYSLFLSIPLIITYHFAAMYYVIRWPYMIISEVKKKGIFSRK